MSVLLGGYAAKTCARRLHNDHDPTMHAPEFEPSAVQELLWGKGRDFETQVLADLRAALGTNCVDLSRLDAPGTKKQHITATLAAMAAGALLVVGGRLPDDRHGRRTGKPDLLVRGADRRDGGPGYLPGDVKAHQSTRERAKGVLRHSAADAPTRVLELAGAAAAALEPDTLQLAHYWRMLQACGWAADERPRGAVIGTSTVAPAVRTLVWQWLDEPLYLTFSRSRGSARRSALERYDHEFGFRLDVVDAAVRRTGAPGDPLPLVEPILRDECDGCAWEPVCEALLEPDDPSRVQRGRLDVRQWDALRQAGIGQAQLAALDADALRGDAVTPGSRTDATLQAYLPQVTHLSRRKALTSLADAVVRADMAEHGEVLRRTTTGAIPVPRADVEVDVDLEWHEDGAVYLHGFLVRDGAQEPQYVAFVDLDALKPTAELALAEAALQWLLVLERSAVASGRTLLVYHYSHPERSKVLPVLERGGSSLTDEFRELVGRCYVDLLPLVKGHYFGLHGLGLKTVAGALGFAWRAEDAGGLQSQAWLAQALADPQDAAAREWLLDYNADDVMATAHVRDALSARPAPAGQP